MGMAGDEPHSEPEPQGGSGVTLTPAAAATLIGGIVAIIIVLALVIQGGGSDNAASPGTYSPLPTEPVDVAVPSTSPPEPSVDRPDVPPVGCNGLWSDDELVLALGSEERPYSALSSMRFSGGEVCTEQLASDDAYFIKVEPGDPSDFTPGAMLNGVTGEPVADVGDDARWFGGSDDGDAPALLAVFEETTVGELMFRVSIGRPDLSRAEQLTVIVELARAILPNFPFVEVEPPEPTVIEVDRALPPALPLTLDDLVVAGEESGEWTRGEGLVQALRYLADEASEFKPPDELDLFNGSGTGVVWLALDYLEDGPDDTTRAEIERLLALFTFPEPPTPATPVAEDEDVASGDGAGAPVLLAFSPAQEPGPEPDPGCGLDPDWFGIDCMAVEDIGVVRFGFPMGAIEGSVEGWDIGDIELVRTSIQTAIAEYTKYGTLMNADVILSPYSDGFGKGTPSRFGDRCLVELRTAMQGLDAGEAPFYVGLELAACFLAENLPREVFRSYSASRWWFQGLTFFLAAEAFPNADIEWGPPTDQLEEAELSTSLMQRTMGNWPFFRSVAANGGGPATALGVVAPLTDADTTQAQMEKLAAQSASDPALHVFHQELSDAKIPDTGSGGRYSPKTSTEIDLDGDTVILDQPIRFGVTRLQLTVSPGMYACIEYDISGNILSSWRAGTPGSGGGSWSFDLPDELTGEAVFLLTTVEEGENFGATVEVGDEPGCEEEEEDPDDIEPSDCGFCSPSEYYRSTGAD
jgi:hypothetical protein